MKNIFQFCFLGRLVADFVKWEVRDTFMASHGTCEEMEALLCGPFEGKDPKLNLFWRIKNKIKNLIQCVNPAGFSGARNLSGANQRGPQVAASTFFWPITSVGFFCIARQRSTVHQRSTIHRVASLWFVRLNCAFWPLWNPTEHTQILTRRPYLPVSRARFYALYKRNGFFYFG